MSRPILLTRPPGSAGGLSGGGIDPPPPISTPLVTAGLPAGKSHEVDVVNQHHAVVHGRVELDLEQAGNGEAGQFDVEEVVQVLSLSAVVSIQKASPPSEVAAGTAQRCEGWCYVGIGTRTFSGRCRASLYTSERACMKRVG